MILYHGFQFWREGEIQRPGPSTALTAGTSRAEREKGGAPSGIWLHAVGTLADQGEEFRASLFLVAEDAEH
jgi:hypothetical protein